MIDLEAILERAEKTTPGPWETNVSSFNTARIWIPHLDEGLYLRLDHANPNLANNCAFIAAARTDVPALIACVRDLAEELKTVSAYLKSCGGEEHEPEVQAYKCIEKTLKKWSL